MGLAQQFDIVVDLVGAFGNQRITAGGEIKRAKPRITSVKKKAVD